MAEFNIKFFDGCVVMLRMEDGTDLILSNKDNTISVNSVFCDVAVLPRAYNSIHVIKVNKRVPTHLKERNK